MQHGGRRDGSRAASRPVRAAAQAVATLLVAALLALVPVVAAPQVGAVTPGSPGVSERAVDPGTPEVSIATGEAHSCALTVAGTVDCWGDNSAGQATDQTATTYVAVTAGWLHTCAITTAGTIDCWGYNNQGQADDQTGNTYVAVSAGYQSTCAITTTAALQCWGQIDAPPAGTFTAVAAGPGGHACAVTAGGAVDCWGSNDNGQAADQPFGTPGAGIGYTAVGVGLYHSCALTTAGTVDCWGLSNWGQAADQAAQQYTALAVGYGYSCAVATAGIVDCWGLNTSGQAVDQGGTNGVLAIDAGATHTCAVLDTGAVDCWGDNAFGKAADQAGPAYAGAAVTLGETFGCALITGGRVDCFGEPTYYGDVVGDVPSGGFVAIDAGDHHVCGLTLVGTIDCWGSSNNGQAEDQTSIPYRSVSGGGHHTCALTATGTVDCWGFDYSGQAADQTSAQYTAVSAGGRHTCGLLAGGDVDCWGDDGEGQAADQSGPYVAVTAGRDHTCALRPNGTVDCWGRNTSGQAADRADVRFRSISAGSRHTCGVTMAGTIDCWGDPAALGSLNAGLGTVPRFTAVAAGDSGHSCARQTTGRLHCWGQADGPRPLSFRDAIYITLPVGEPASVSLADLSVTPLDPVSYSAAYCCLPSGMALGADGILSGTPTTGSAFTLRASNAYAESYAGVNVEVRTRPSLVVPGDQTAAPGQTVGPLDLFVADDYGPSSLVAVTATSSDQDVLPDGGITIAGTGFARTITLDPSAEAGNVTVTVTATSVITGLDREISFVVRWAAAPMISAIADRSTPEGTPAGPITFLVADGEYASSALVVTAASSNTTLVPNGSIALAGTGSSRTVTVTPVAGRSGTADITLTVTDPTGLTATETFTLTVTPTSARIVGTVTEDGSGTPIGNVTVRLFSGMTAIATTTTAADGSYSFTVAPGSGYKLRFLPSVAHASEYWSNAGTLQGAASMAVAVGGTQQANASLLPAAMAAKVTGTVTDAGTGLPVANHLVTLHRDGIPLHSVRTSASGRYTFANLDPSGRWDLRVADGSTHGVQWWPAAPVRILGTPLALTGGATTTIDASVTKVADLGDLAGTVVTAADGTTPLAGVQVRVLRDGVWLRTATTNASGAYAVAGLLPGTYTVRLIDPSADHWSWWDDVVVAPGPPTVLDAAMQPV